MAFFILFPSLFFFPPEYFIDSSNNRGNLVTIISKELFFLWYGWKENSVFKGLPSCDKRRHKIMCAYICRKKTFRMVWSLGRAVEKTFHWIFYMVGFLSYGTIKKNNDCKFKNKETKSHWLGLFDWPLGVFMTILNILSKMGKKFWNGLVYLVFWSTHKLTGGLDSVDTAWEKLIRDHLRQCFWSVWGAGRRWGVC